MRTRKAVIPAFTASSTSSSAFAEDSLHSPSPPAFHSSLSYPDLFRAKSGHHALHHRFKSGFDVYGRCCMMCERRTMRHPSREKITDRHLMAQIKARLDLLSPASQRSLQQPDLSPLLPLRRSRSAATPASMSISDNRDRSYVELDLRSDLRSPSRQQLPLCPFSVSALPADSQRASVGALSGASGVSGVRLSSSRRVKITSPDPSQGDDDDPRYFSFSGSNLAAFASASVSASYARTAQVRASALCPSSLSMLDRRSHESPHERTRVTNTQGQLCGLFFDIIYSTL